MNVTKYRVFVKAGIHAIYSNTWSSKDEMFYEVANIDYYEKEITVWGCGFEDCGACDDSYKFEDVIIMPYIGLKDSNGRDIYEGDILQVFSFKDNDAFKGEIIFAGGAFCLEIKLDDKNYKVPLVTTQDYPSDFYLNVLGNVYENPELLEVE